MFLRTSPIADTIISHDIITSWYFFLFFFFFPLRPIYTSARHFRYLIIVVCTLIAENLEGWSWWRAPQSSEISLFTARTVSALLFFLYSSVQLSPLPPPRLLPHNRVSWCAHIACVRVTWLNSCQSDGPIIIFPERLARDLFFIIARLWQAAHA